MGRVREHLSGLVWPETQREHPFFFGSEQSRSPPPTAGEVVAGEVERLEVCERAEAVGDGAVDAVPGEAELLQLGEARDRLQLRP